METKETIKPEDSAPKIPWSYEHSIWKPIYQSIRSLIVAWAIYDYRNWIAIVFGVMSFFSLIKELIEEAMAEAIRKNLKKGLEKNLEEISNKLGYKKNVVAGLDDLDKKLDDLYAALEGIESNTEKRH